MSMHGRHGPLRTGNSFWIMCLDLPSRSSRLRGYRSVVQVFDMMVLIVSGLYVPQMRLFLHSDGRVMLLLMSQQMRAYASTSLTSTSAAPHDSIACPTSVAGARVGYRLFQRAGSDGAPLYNCLALGLVAEKKFKCPQMKSDAR